MKQGQGKEINMMNSDYLLRAIKKLIEALVRAESAVKIQDQEETDEAEKHLDQSFENLTGFSPANLEVIPSNMVTHILKIQGKEILNEEADLVREYWRLKLALLEKKKQIHESEEIAQKISFYKKMVEATSFSRTSV